MKTTTKVILIVCLALMAVSAYAADPIYIYGMHDPGGEYLMANKGVKGWIVFTEAIGADPGNYSGKDFSSWYNQGYGVIVRINHGYDSSGNLPYESQYDNFAQRCKNYVAASPGVNYWIIGNETNLPREWPGNVGGDPNTGEAITPARYISCYNKCYTKIKELGSQHLVCPSPSGTWAPPYDGTCGGFPNRGVPGYINYWTQCINGIGATKIDGLIVHTYTHGCDPALITDNTTMGGCYAGLGYYYNFRAYRNYMNAIPTAMKTKPVMITESDQNVECASGGYTWYNSNNGWVRAAYAEINNWNNTSGNQKIRAFVLFRWPDVWEGAWNFSISTKQGVIDDWNQAMDYQYKWTSSVGTIAGNVKDSGGANLSGATVSTTTGGYTTTTNSSGNYTLANVATGTYSVVASKSGYNTNTQTGKTVSSGATTTVNFTLTSSGGMNNNVPTGTNLALKITRIGTDTDYSVDYDGNKARDGSTSTKWCSTNAASTHVIRYDLGAYYTVNGYIVKLGSTGGDGVETNLKNFQIQTADNWAGPWTDETVVDNSAQAGTINRSYSTPKAVRYVRLYITNCGVDNHARLPEFEVRGTDPGMNTNTPTGTNVALSATAVETDTAYSSSYDGAKAKDGTVTTKWCSTGASATHWLSYDLGARIAIKGFVVRHASTNGESTTMNTEQFRIQSSTSLTGPWVDEVSVSNTSQAAITTRTYNLAKTMRYVRLYITDPGIDNYARIPEFEVIQ